MSMKIVSDLKAKAIDFEAKHRIVPKAMGAAAALTVTAFPASAAEGDTSSNSEVIKSAIESGLKELIVNLSDVVAAVIPLAIGCWGLVIMVGYAKKFFTKIVGS